jgi:hypothetical protein
MHLPPGFSGSVAGIVFALTIFPWAYYHKEHEAYNLDPKALPGAFEPILAKYLRAAEFAIGLATGSIVLLVGSSVFHGQGGHLPWFFASPLLLLAFCVVWGIAFMVRLIHNYEEYQHGNPHTAFAYSLSQALGFGSLFCFCTGYCWLIVCVTVLF